ncbi:MAG TPA: UMP kinase [Candidatus Saccharimonadales bacterium]|nr:UMP kinase [Candidatus Saccharimonadales bacterium]
MLQITCHQCFERDLQWTILPFDETSATLWAMYKRVLVKFSGEQLSGKHEFGIDTDIARYLAHESKKVVDAGCQLALVVGGGNVVRGASLAGHGIKRVTADQMGMLSGLMNAMALTDVFEAEGVLTRCMSMIFAEQVAESYSYRRAEKHLEQRRVLIIAGGIARPYFTHDTAAVSLALELDCNVVIKTTKVDGVYTKDPIEHPDATMVPKMSYKQAVEDNAIRIMDKAALGLAMEQNMPLVVLDAMRQSNILRAVQGKVVGTRIG